MKQTTCRNLRGACAAVIPGEMLVAMVKSVISMSRKGRRRADVIEGGLLNHARFHAHQRQRSGTLVVGGFKIGVNECWQGHVWAVWQHTQGKRIAVKVLFIT